MPETTAPRQYAALCYRDGKDGLEVLLVRSSRGRWILPKGQPIKGLDGAETALREAWEEAGVRRGKADAKPYVRYESSKRLEGGDAVPFEMIVHPIRVKETAKTYPESDKRERKWAALDRAIKLVDEPALAEVLQRFGKEYRAKRG